MSWVISSRLLVATADQVEPLLPGGATCTVLVTSRRWLPALINGFPLALGLITARIRIHPGLLDEIVADLRDLGLDALDSDNPSASLPSSPSLTSPRPTHAGCRPRWKTRLCSNDGRAAGTWCTT